MEESQYDIALFGIEFLKNCFNHIVHEKGEVRDDEIIIFPHFESSGMYGRMVNKKWWEETGFPLLDNRLKEIID